MESKHKNALIGALLAVVFVMAVGYAAFATNLNINGTANINSSWNVHIKSITPSATAVGTYSNGETTYTTAGSIKHEVKDNYTAEFSAILLSPSESVTYTVTVENPASNSLVANTGNTTIKVTAEFKNENVTSLAGEESAGITVTIVASQAQ